MSQLDISDSLSWEEGLPRPQWDLLTQWVATRARDNPQAAWTDIVAQWLEHMAEPLGAMYQIVESKHFLVLGYGPAAETLARDAELMRKILLKQMPDVADLAVPGKHAVLAFRDSESYYDYTAVFHLEGRHGATSGMQIREGYPHIALWGPDIGPLECTLAHEMVHASLTHLRQPQWLEEGLAQMFEHIAVGRGEFMPTPDDGREHKQHWNRHGLEDFWWGNAFHKSGRGQTLSYQLAELLVRILFEDHRPRWFGLDRRHYKRLLRFLQTADREDGGQAASQQHLGFGLEKLAEQFLGPGEWEPWR